MADILPVEIIHDIISRLSTETVLLCKQVCKRWKDLLSGGEKSIFSKMHLQRLNRQHDLDNFNNGSAAGNCKVCLGFIFLLRSSEHANPSYGHQLHYGEYQQHHNDGGSLVKKSSSLRLIDHPKIRTRVESGTNMFVGSYNGLICIAESKINLIKDPIHICNPITRECVRLPGFNDDNQWKKSVCEIYSGFGYSHSTNEYKVVRIINTRGVNHIQVYTIGSTGNGGWRNKGVINGYGMFSSVYGVFAYGNLHWQHPSTAKKMNIFDLSDETFNVIPGSPFYFPNYHRSWLLRSWCGEPLYGVGVQSGRNNIKYVDIWSFKKTNTSSQEGSTSTATASRYSKYDESWRWCKEFSFNTSSSEFAPFAVTKSGLVVARYSHPHISKRTVLCILNPKTKSQATLGDLSNFVEVMPYTNSLVSLEDLGEAEFKKRKSRKRKPT